MSSPETDNTLPKHSIRSWLRKIAGPEPVNRQKRRRLCCHSVALFAICFVVGLLIPALLITSVAFFQNPLAVLQGCRQTNTSAAFSYNFSCDSYSLTKIVLIIAIVHLAVGAICLPIAWQLARRCARRQLDKLEGKGVKRYAAEIAEKKMFLEQSKRFADHTEAYVGKLEQDLQVGEHWRRPEHSNGLISSDYYTRVPRTTGSSLGAINTEERRRYLREHRQAIMVTATLLDHLVKMPKVRFIHCTLAYTDSILPL